MLSLIELLVIFLAIISARCGVSKHNPFYCYSEDPIRQWTELGAIHSPYEFHRGQTINANVSTCNPTKFWMLGRHGSRWPYDTEVTGLLQVVNAVHSQLLANYNQGRTSLCASDFELLRNWQINPNLTVDDALLLSPSGWIEMEALAKRFQAAFPTILSETYSPKDYFFRPTFHQRTQYSLYAFADGLFGVDGHKQVQLEEVTELDLYLRPEYECPPYLDIDVREEQAAFMQGPEFQQMVIEVSSKLGFHHSHVLRDSEIGLLALYCKYEQTWNLDHSSPFCAAFSTANAQVFEYSQDLRWYRQLGHGQPEHRRLLENLYCFVLQDMLRFIQSNDINDHKVRIFSGHVGHFLILLHFEVFNEDEIFTRHNFAQQTERVWRSTELLPMACNLAVIRYDCAGGDNDLLFLYNEIPLQIPGCDSNGVCKQSLILQRFDRYLNGNCTEIFCTNT